MTKPIDLSAIKAAALAATGGPWAFDPKRHTHDCHIYQANTPVPEYGYYDEESGGIVGSSEWNWLKEANGKYIALMSPDVTLALIERLERAESDAEKWREQEARHERIIELSGIDCQSLAIESPYKAVDKWHRAMNLPVGTSSFDDPKYKTMRARLIAEECAETLAALLGCDIDIKKYSDEILDMGTTIAACWLDKEASRVEFLDGICDLIFVCAGSAVELGDDLDGAFAEVCRSNHTKVGATTDSGGKVGKGDRFDPPQLAPFIGSKKV